MRAVFSVKEGREFVSVEIDRTTTLPTRLATEQDRERFAVDYAEWKASLAPKPEPKPAPLVAEPEPLPYVKPEPVVLDVKRSDLIEGELTQKHPPLKPAPKKFPGFDRRKKG